MNFYETETGQKFFNCQLPTLIETLQSIASSMKQRSATVHFPDMNAEGNGILHKIYNGTYQPESQKRKKGDPLDRSVLQTAHTLLNTLSPKQQKLFCEYEDAVNIRGDSANERAFKDGFRLAVQMILDGYGAPDAPVQDIPAKG